MLKRESKVEDIFFVYRNNICDMDAEAKFIIYTICCILFYMMETGSKNGITLILFPRILMNVERNKME